jgi:exodeoxyribonuclease VIII
MTTDYYTIPRESASGLKPILASPKLYRYWRDNDHEPTDPMALGTAAHCAVLEPEQYNQRFAIWNERADSGRKSPRSPNNSKWTDFLACNAGREILTEDQDREARHMAEAVHAHPGAREILSRGQAEVPILWTHRESGVDCKSKIDWLRPDMIVDVKTTVSLARFGTQAARLRVPFQMAMYQEAVASFPGPGQAHLPVKLIVVESKPPFDVAVFRVPDATLAVGQRDMREAFRRLLECRSSGQWPGLGAEELELVLPPWATGDEDDEWDVTVTEEAA